MKHTQICPTEHGASREMSHTFRCTRVEATVRLSSFFERRPSAAVGLKLAAQGRFLELVLGNGIFIIRPTPVSSTNRRSYHCRGGTIEPTWDISSRPGNLDVEGNMGRVQFSTLPLCV